MSIAKRLWTIAMLCSPVHLQNATSTSGILQGSSSDHISGSNDDWRKNIVFVVIGGSMKGRYACSVESAARHNPSMNVMIVYLKEVSDRPQFPFQNVRSVEVDGRELLKDTPLEGLMDMGENYIGVFPANVSDFVRFAYVYKHGGLYMDLDIITLRSFNDLEENFVAFQMHASVNPAHFRFSPRHPFLYDTMKQVRKCGVKDGWSSTGPSPITTTYGRWCRDFLWKPYFGEVRCRGLLAYPQQVFSPYPPSSPWSTWKCPIPSKFSKVIANSHALHYWNFLSHYWKLDLSSNMPIAVLARRHCKWTIDAFKDNF